MKNLSDKKLVLIKKCIVVGCAGICLLLMLLNTFKYTSSSSLSGGGDSITWSDSFSLYDFLFNGNLTVLDSKVTYLRELFSFSYVVMWISFILSPIALLILSYGIFNKKNLFSKVGSIIIVVSTALLILISFDTHSLGRTTKYLTVFTPFYLIALSLSVISLVTVLSIKEE